MNQLVAFSTFKMLCNHHLYFQLSCTFKSDEFEKIYITSLSRCKGIISMN